eukprot:TRINITY_DN105838_c0_g1_i1.p1 TRINITY_DN105838_c0_g1~~TRINITY_DN105838_c0_g1_i1.p1  ORF type:complete len:288 (+),score=56.71 TRINITY_DN105838_c0_g1_i1:120-983(+)
MALQVHVTCESASPGDLVGLAGSDAAFGEWKPESALRLQPTEDSPPSFSALLPQAPTGGEFKLFVAKQGETAWEPLPENRRWPTTGLDNGGTLKMVFGQPKIAIEASADAIEAAARAYRRLEERQGSALQENVDRKGENAYYFAHNRKFEVPPDAKVITGPGLITGGAPTLIEAGTTTVDASEEDRTVYLKDYSWSDSTGKVKVYVPIPEGILPASGADEIVDISFAAHQVELTVKSRPRQRLKIEKLNAELKVDSCSSRVEAHKNRIVLQLAKKRETTWYSLTKGK